MASEFEWAESAEVTLLTEVEIQSQLNFCRCSHRAEVTSPSLEYSALLLYFRIESRATNVVGDESDMCLRQGNRAKTKSPECVKTISIKTSVNTWTELSRS